MSGFGEYDSDQWTLSINGVLIQDGFADGEWLRIEQESDDFSDVVGTDGFVTRSKTNDRRAGITIILMQTSPSNAFLSALSNLDKSAPNGAGIVPMMVRNRQGLALYTAEHAWIMRTPDISLDREPTAREWGMRCAKLVRLDAN